MRNGVPFRIDAGLQQQPAQPHLDPRRRTDAAALNGTDVAALGAEILMQDQKPVHALGLRAQQLHALPLRKRGERRMRGAADEIHAAIAQGLIGLIDGKNELELNVEPLLLEEAKLDRGDRRKIGI